MSQTPSPSDLLMGMVDARLAQQRTTQPPIRDFRTRVPVTLAPLVYKAAADRGMSVGAFSRRAMLAFVAFDQHLDLRELLADEPATRIRFESPAVNRLEAGEGHGLWRIGSLY